MDITSHTIVSKYVEGHGPRTTIINYLVCHIISQDPQHEFCFVCFEIISDLYLHQKLNIVHISVYS